MDVMLFCSGENLRDLGRDPSSDFAAFAATGFVLRGFLVELSTAAEKGSECGDQPRSFEDSDHVADRVWRVEEVDSFH